MPADRSHASGLRLQAVALLITSAAATLAWATGSPIHTTHHLVQLLVGHGGADLDQLLSGAAALAAWLLLIGVAAVIALELAASAPGWVGKHARTVAARVSPPMIRRLAHAAIGLTVVVGPLSAGSALAAGSSAPSAPAVASSSPASPSVDGPSGSPSSDGSSSGSPSSATSGPDIGVPLDRPVISPPALSLVGGVELDRPAAAYVPVAPPASRLSTPTGPIRVLSGTASREAAPEGYVVRRGDSLWDVAARHLGPTASAADVARDWPRWYATNRAVIGVDPAVIRPGEVLQPPPT